MFLVHFSCSVSYTHLDVYKRQTERHVDKEALSVGSGEIADAIDPYGILMEV